MTQRSPVLRACLFAAAVLQLSAPAAAAFADARLDGVVTGPSHIESHSTAACGRIHPADCIFHRFLSTPVVAGRPLSLGTRLAPRSQPAPAAVSGWHAWLHERLPDSRAPPSLS
jgi:hypothetical protein